MENREPFASLLKGDVKAALTGGLDEGPKRGWTIVSMKDDRKSVFPD